MLNILDNYEYIYDTYIYQNSLLEAYVASISFFVWGCIYFILDYTSFSKYKYTSNNKKSINHIDHNLKIKDGIYSLYSMVCYLISIYILHIYVNKIYIPEFRTLPSLFRFITELSTGIILYDFIFWFIHLSLHKVPLFYKYIHSTHHTHTQLSACITVKHSLIDAALQVGVNILVQNISFFGNKHIVSRLCHNILITYMLMEIHTEYNLPWALHNIFPSIFGGSLRHRYHHASLSYNVNGNKNVFYHQFFKYMDDLCGYCVSDQECLNI